MSRICGEALETSCGGVNTLWLIVDPVNFNARFSRYSLEVH